MMTTMTTTARAAGAGRAVAGASRAVAGAMAAAVRYVRREREIARARSRMAEMSDAMLKDIGIDRFDVDVAARFGRRGDWRRNL